MMGPEMKELTVEITQKCPNRCLHCSSLSSINATHKLEHVDVLSVAKQAATLGLKRICISGGEPLYHPDIVKIINDITALGLDISIYTTGIGPCDDKTGAPYQDWDLFIDKDKITLIFNIQSIHEEIHDRFTSNTGSFKKTKEALLIAKEKGFRVENHIVPNKLNLASLETTANTLIEWGVNKVSFLRLVPQGYARLNLDFLELNEADQEMLHETINSLATKDKNESLFRFGIPFSHDINKTRVCNAAENKLIVRYDGKVLPCEAFKDAALSKFVLGDIRDSSLSNLLQNGFNHHELLELKKMICMSTNPETCVAQVLFQGFQL